MRSLAMTVRRHAIVLVLIACVGAQAESAPPADQPIRFPVLRSASVGRFTTPEYPKAALRDGVTGRVVFRVMLNGGGGADSVDVLERAAEPLVEAASKAVMSASFAAPLINHLARATGLIGVVGCYPWHQEAIVTFDFQIEDGTPTVKARAKFAEEATISPSAAAAVATWIEKSEFGTDVQPSFHSVVYLSNNATLGLVRTDLVGDPAKLEWLSGKPPVLTRSAVKEMERHLVYSPQAGVGLMIVDGSGHVVDLLALSEGPTATAFVRSAEQHLQHWEFTPAKGGDSATRKLACLEFGQFERKD
jgi:TonB family protein